VPTVVLWVFAVIGMVATALFIAFLLDTPPDGHLRKIGPEASSKPERTNAPAAAPTQMADAQAVHDRDLWAQYQETIRQQDEDGEQILRRKAHS
jgi:hypothetical protein